MRNSGKTVFIVLGVISLFLLSFGLFECNRLNNLYENAPKYVVEQTMEDAINSAKELAEKSGGTYSRSEGYSNYNSLPFSKSIIVIEKVPFGELKQHDFVGYQVGTTRIFHRLVKKVDGGWVAQGDNNANVDRSLVTEENYLGRLVEPIFTWDKVSQK